MYTIEVKLKSRTIKLTNLEQCAIFAKINCLVKWKKFQEWVKEILRAVQHKHFGKKKKPENWSASLLYRSDPFGIMMV